MVFGVDSLCASGCSGKHRFLKMYQWSYAERVIGRVIAVEPENTPFPDRLRIRYLRPEDDQEFNVTLSAFSNFGATGGR